MDWNGLFRKISSEHPHEPQLLGRCELAIANAKEALQILAGHGYHFHLADGAGTPYPEWPKKLYHVDSSSNGTLVYTQQEAEALGPGWFDSLQKAQFWDGMEHQFHGRGGVKLSARLPLPIFGAQSTSDSEEARQRADLIAAFRALNRWERPAALESDSTDEVGMPPATVLETEPGAETSRDRGAAPESEL